jgi:DNA-directed RNA polymerase II subunit RPB2
MSSFSTSANKKNKTMKKELDAIKSSELDTKLNILNGQETDVSSSEEEEHIEKVSENKINKDDDSDTEDEESTLFEENDDIKLDKNFEDISTSFFAHESNKKLIKHQIDSYNDFINVKINTIVKQYNPIVVYHNYSEEHCEYQRELSINFGKVYITEPRTNELDDSQKSMYPSEARLRNLTYSSKIYVDTNIKITERKGDDFKTIEKKEKKLDKVIIGNIPIMVGSNYCMLTKTKINKSVYGECKHDYGGYFIINGSEKVLISQERQAENKAYVFNNSKQNSKYSHIVEMKSVLSEKITPAKSITVKLTSKPNEFGRVLKATIPHIKQDIPLFILFRALGIDSDKEILKYIVLGKFEDNEEYLKLLKPSIEEASNIHTNTLALEYLTKYIHIQGTPKEIKIDNDFKIKKLKEALREELFSHIGTSLKKKALTLGLMVKKLLDLFLGKIEQDNRDSYINKRIDTPGILLSNIFRQYFTKMIKDMKNSIMKEMNQGAWRASNKTEDIVNATNAFKIIKSTTIDGGIKYSLATGNWGMKNTSKKVGVAQVLSRLSYNSMLSHLRRLNTPIEKSGKLILPRKLHPSSWGFVCPAETPEGAAIGVVKNLALTSTITNFTSIEPVLYCLKSLDVKDPDDLSIEEIYGKCKIFINGNWCGVSDDLQHVYDVCVECKRSGVINPETSICIDYKTCEIFIYTDAGRLIRPVLIVENNKLLLRKKHLKLLQNKDYNWKNLIIGNAGSKLAGEHNALIEYICPQSTDNSLIAPDQQFLAKQRYANHMYSYTHCEIHQSLILGVLASSIPFSDHNQSPRNTYQSAMGKQAMGIYATNFHTRMDTLAHILHYPMKPIVNTTNMKYLNSDETPNGMMAVVAIMTYSGYNQEDSVILNQTAVDNGLFTSTFYRSYKDEEKKNQISGAEEKFCIPTSMNTKGLKPGSYEHLDETGFAKVNNAVNGGDIIIGKVIPMKEDKKKMGNMKKFKDNSTALRVNESGTIDQIYQNHNGDGNHFCKTKVRSVRNPQIGDKFSSRHGQKGTVGMTYRHQDMPYTVDGIVPDIIINTHAIPSRMTIAHLIECVTGKACTQLGMSGDGTPFNSLTIEEIADILKNECHMNSTCDEILYNGFDGKQLQCKIFMGPTYYQRLKHMVDDKIHSRATGPLVLLTRQPAEGRARDGGLRFGEMERDCLKGDTKISLNFQKSVKISSMRNNILNVLTYDIENEHFVKTKQLEFEKKPKKRDCMEVMLEDGRTFIATPMHKCLCEDGTYKYVKDLEKQPTTLKAGIEYPFMDIQKDMQECNGWTKTFGTLTLNTDTEQRYIKTLKFMRILGYFITDGSLYESGNRCSGNIYLGHKIDLTNILHDLETFCGKIKHGMKLVKNKNYYSISLKKSLVDVLCNIDGVASGKKVNSEGLWPDFVLDENFPVPLLKEFLGGVFGGDGHSCTISTEKNDRPIKNVKSKKDKENKISGLHNQIVISKTKNTKHTKNLEFCMKQLEKLLNRCGIHNINIPDIAETTVSKTKTNNDDKTYQLKLSIHSEDIFIFHENINYTYCCHKSHRLEATIAYMRYKNTMIRQRNWIVQRVDELTNYVKQKNEAKANNTTIKLSTFKEIPQAFNELQEREGIIDKGVKPAGPHDICDYLIKGSTYQANNCMCVIKFMKNIGVFERFKDANSNGKCVYGVNCDNEGLPSMNLKVISVKKCKEKHNVYDIEVEEHHNFIANGVVVHNCMIAHGASEFLKERLLDMSDHYRVFISKKTGLISAVNPEKNIYKSFSNDGNDFSEIRIPYAYKLLMQELETMGICSRLMTA